MQQFHIYLSYIFYCMNSLDTYYLVLPFYLLWRVIRCRYNQYIFFAFLNRLRTILSVFQLGFLCPYVRKEVPSPFLSFPKLRKVLSSPFLPFPKLRKVLSSSFCPFPRVRKALSGPLCPFPKPRKAFRCPA